MNGQIEPALLRKSATQKDHYEIITGSRRWKACSEVNLPLKAIVQDLSDAQAAIAQIRENQKLPLCDYSKGIYYASLLADKTMNLTKGKLSDLIGCSRAKLDNYLAFEKVLTSIWDAVGNVTRVSSRSAATIHNLAKRGEDYKAALIEIADDIRKGAGSKTIETKVLAEINGGNNTIDYQQSISLPSGQAIAKWTKTGLQFAKDVPINQKEIADTLIQYFQNATVTSKNNLP